MKNEFILQKIMQSKGLFIKMFGEIVYEKIIYRDSAYQTLQDMQAKHKNKYRNIMDLKPIIPLNKGWLSRILEIVNSFSPKLVGNEQQQQMKQTERTV